MTANHAEAREAVVARIADRLEIANGRRRVRTLELAEVLGLIRDVAGGSAFRYRTGGTIANAYNYPAVTTYAMAARVDGRIYLGITEADAKAASPCRAWSCLQPWRKAKSWPVEEPEGPAGDPAPKWGLWSRSAGVLEIEAAEVDALLEGGAD